MNENKLKPSLRFKGFTDPWEQRKLEEAAPLRGGYAFKSTEYRSEGIPIIRISNILSDGSIGKEFLFYDEQINDENFVLNNESALLAMSGATTGKVSILRCKKADKYYQNQRVGYFTRNNQYDYTFISTVVRSELFKEKLDNVLVAGAQPNVSSKDIDSFEFMFPKEINEQTKIGNLFKNLDSLITLHQRKCDKLSAIKKGLLDKMFPSDGENIPKIRFKGFTDPWEQCKLGDIGKCQSGIGFPDNEQGGKIGTPFYKVSDMNNYGNEHEMICANNYVTNEQIFRKNWKPITELPTVIFAKVGAAIMLNRKRLCRFPFLLDNNTMAYKFGNMWNSEFGKTLFEKIDLTDLVHVGALPSYNVTDVENIDIQIPSNIEEQQQIGNFFDNLDRLITLHQRKLKKLKNIKKSLLDRMFI